MCGIASVREDGQLNRAKEIAEFLTKSQTNRGEDGYRVYQFGGPFQNTAIGHTRYQTNAYSEHDQPYAGKGFILSVNGQILNRTEDTAAIQNIFANNLPALGWQGCLSKIALELAGDYAGTFILQDTTLVGFRDPLGMRPLYFGMADELFAFASESSSLIRDGLFTKDQVDAVPRGSYIAVLPDGEVEVKPFSDPVENEAACHFEWTYFLKRASIFKELAAHRLRYKLGVALAEQEQLWFEKNTIIVPVPYTAKDAARGYSERFGGPRIAEAMDRERGSSRTFITGRHDRLDRIKEKYLFVPDLIEGRPVVVIDDSIVRGATLEYIGRGLKNAGATEVHFKSTCPPITHPCPYAINFHTEKELFTNREDKNLPEGIDTLTYLSLENYKRAFEQLRVNPNSLCTGCLTGKYPHDV